MYRLAQRTDRRTDIQTDNGMMPIPDYIACMQRYYRLINRVKRKKEAMQTLIISTHLFGHVYCNLV